MKHLCMVAILAVVTGCASVPAADTAPATGADAAASFGLDPVGTYVLSATVQGMAVEGQMGIIGEPGDWSGSLYTDITGELPLSSIRVQGQELRVTASTPDGPLNARLVFIGDMFTGDWSLGGEGGALRGRRVDS